MFTHSQIIADTMKQGGGTYRADLRGKAELPDTGYMVGNGKIAQLQLPVTSPNQITYALDRASEACVFPNEYVGTWVDNHVMYIDVSLYVAEKFDAIELCRNHGETAYYDIAKGESVTLPVRLQGLTAKGQQQQ